MVQVVPHPQIVNPCRLMLYGDLFLGVDDFVDDFRNLKRQVSIFWEGGKDCKAILLVSPLMSNCTICCKFTIMPILAVE